VGGPGSPHAIGAAVRVVYSEGPRGPLREVHGGSGYWSEDGAVQVLGVEQGRQPTGVWTRWPGGAETITPLAPGTSETTIRAPE